MLKHFDKTNLLSFFGHSLITSNTCRPKARKAFPAFHLKQALSWQKPFVGLETNPAPGHTQAEFMVISGNRQMPVVFFCYPKNVQSSDWMPAVPHHPPAAPISYATGSIHALVRSRIRIIRHGFFTASCDLARLCSHSSVISDWPGREPQPWPINSLAAKTQPLFIQGQTAHRLWFRIHLALGKLSSNHESSPFCR